MWRRFASVFLALVLLSAAGSGSVEEARREAAEAQVRFEGAEDRLAEVAGARSGLDARLAVTLDEYRAVTLAMENASLAVASLRREIEVTEEAVSGLRRRAEEAAVTAYMGAVAGMAVTPWAAGSPEQLISIGESVSVINRHSLAVVPDLVTHRHQLDQLRLDHGAASESLGELRERVSAEAARLEDSLWELDQAVALAYRALGSAEAEYRAALTVLERAERRAAALRGVEHWRPLVARSFPADLVDEALSVMRCESGGNPDALHPASGAAGLFQFMEGTWAWVSVRMGRGGASRFDPEANVAGAAWLVDYSIRTGHRAGAWGRWTCQPSA